MKEIFNTSLWFINVTCLELLRVVFNFRRFNYLSVTALAKTKNQLESQDLGASGGAEDIELWALLDF